MKRRSTILVTVALALVGMAVLYLGSMFLLHHLGFRGEGSVRRISDLPYGFGAQFEGLKARGPIEYYYHYIGPRRASCLFTGSARNEDVQAFCESRENWHIKVGTRDWSSEVRGVGAPCEVADYQDSEGDFSAHSETEYGRLDLGYSSKANKFVGYANLEWPALRRKSKWWIIE